MFLGNNIVHHITKNIGQEILNLRNARGQPGQCSRYPPDQAMAICLILWHEVMILELLKDKSVQGIGYPGSIIQPG